MFTPQRLVHLAQPKWKRSSACWPRSERPTTSNFLVEGPLTENLSHNRSMGSWPVMIRRDARAGAHATELLMSIWDTF